LIISLEQESVPDWDLGFQPGETGFERRMRGGRHSERGLEAGAQPGNGGTASEVV
jgi:hypothetical protein